MFRQPPESPRRKYAKRRAPGFSWRRSRRQLFEQAVLAFLIWLVFPKNEAVWNIAVIALALLGSFILLPHLELAWHWTVYPVVQPRRENLALRRILKRTRRELEKLKADTGKDFRFRCGGVSLVTGRRERLRDANEGYIIFTRALLTNPDTVGTSVAFILNIEMADGVPLQVEPEAKVWESVLDAGEKASGSKHTDRFSRVENIPARSSREGWLVFRFDKALLDKLGSAAGVSQRLVLEVQDGMSGHVVTWNATSTLIKLARKRGIALPDAGHS